MAYLALCAGALVPASLIAQTTQTDAETLQAITIISDDQARTGDVISEEQSVSTSRVSREELTQTPSALAAIIARETGVQYRQSGGFGSYASVSIRAASAAQTGVYLNGVLLNSGGNPVVDLSTLEILNLDSVDLYRGSTPLQLGHASIGGAINLSTLSAAATPQTRIRLGLGSYSDVGAQLSHQSLQGRWAVVTAASYRQSKNDFSFNNNNGTPLNPDDDERQTRNNTQAERSALLLQTGYRHSDNARTDLTLQSAGRSLGVPQWRNRTDNTANYDTLSTQLQLSHIRDGIKNWNTRHSIYWHLDDSHYEDLQAQIGLSMEDRRYDTQTAGIKTYWEYPTESGFAGLSVDIRREKLNSEDHLDDTSRYSASRDEWLSAIHYTWFDVSDRWTITPAIRWQRSALSGSSQQGITRQKDEQSDSQTGAQLGISFKPDQRLHFSMNLGSFYRTPSFGELYGSIGLINGNANLRPEQGINADVGVSFTTDNVELSGTLFASQKDELIVTAFDSRGVGRPVNSGEAKVHGLEVGALWAINTYWELRSNMTWQSPKSVDRRSGFKDKFLPGQAQLSWYTRAQYARSQWVYWYELEVERKRFYDRPNNLPAADTNQHTAGIGWQGLQWRANLSIQNLSNANVEDFNGFPKPGRRWSLSVTRTF